jgi:hypothetical protein
MQPSDYTLVERVTDSFTRLSSAAKDLNKVSDDLGKAIAAIDSVLQMLNLGVPTWVQIHGATSQYNGDDYWTRDLGYAKVGSRWGIALRTVDGCHSDPEAGQVESWLFNDAPRWIRVEGIHKIPELLDELIKRTKETTETVKSKIDEANTLAGALRQAAGLPTTQPKKHK